MEKTNTGYPHIDKPWMKFYDENKVNKPFPEMTIYEYFKWMNRNHQDLIATSFYGNNITYGEMMEKIDDTAKGLYSIGVRDGDRVLELLPTLAPTAHLFYANSKIGGVSDFYDPRPDSVSPKVNGEKILSIIDREHIKHIIIFDQSYIPLLSEIEDQLIERGITDLVVVSIDDAMNLKSKINFFADGCNKYGIKDNIKKVLEMKKGSNEVKECLKKSKLNIITYFDLINNSRYTKPYTKEYVPNNLELIVHTSGTSGAFPKPLPLTNDNMNSHIHQLFAADYQYEPGTRIFQMLPYFASFGISDCAHFGFCCGANMIQVPIFSPEELPGDIIKSRAEVLTVAPEMLTPFLKSKKLSNVDLSFLKRITVGGGTFDREKDFIKFLKDHGATNCSVDTGHGMSEFAGSGAVNYGNHRVIGGMGAPLPYTTYMIVDSETKEPIRFKGNENTITGEAMVSGPCVTSGILDGNEIVHHYNIDGIDCIATGDSITMDRDGNMKFNTRIDRTFSRWDGFKYKSYIIENLIKQDERVENCVIVEYYDEDRMGNMPIAHITLRNNDISIDEQQQIIEELLEKYFFSNPSVSTRHIPSKFKFRDEMPLTPNNKTGYNILKKEGIDGTEFTVSFTESNLGISDLHIIKPSIKRLIMK
ncbi:MAG: acyl--CoA ligase [Tenericutes bacterium]|nr:acyl--CoA ligase [Mycoplasmatota bacterium]